MGRGIATEECVNWLRENAHRYLVVSRERTRHFDPEAAQRIETASRHGVHVHKVVSDDGCERRLHCFSEKRANKERATAVRFTRPPVEGSMMTHPGQITQGLGEADCEFRLRRVQAVRRTSVCR